MDHFILNLATPTVGDSDFYSRWERIGMVEADFEKPEYRQFVDVLVVDHRVTVTDALLNEFPKLKFICSANTAHTHIKSNLADRQIELVTLKGEDEFLTGVKSVSEFAMHLILTLARPTNQPGFLLNGKTLGIVGNGRIGKQLAFIAKNGFCMRVLTVDKGTSEEGWTKLFSTCDVISLHLSEEPSTKGIVSKKYLNLMQRHAYLVNTARGSILDERHLVSMLREGLIAGAALDVIHDVETFQCDVDSLIVTDHIAGNTLDDRIRTDEFIVSKLFSKIHRDEMN